MSCSKIEGGKSRFTLAKNYEPRTWKAWAMFVMAACAAIHGQSSPKQMADPAVAALGSGFVSDTARVNGATLHYVRGGAGPAVILLHRFPEDWYEYHRIMPQLAAARTVVPYTYFRKKLVSAGKSKAEIKESIKTAMEKKELPALDAGAMCFMMSKDAYLNDGGGHNMAHLMFYTPLMDGAVWGSNPIDDSNHVSFKFPNSSIFLTPQFLGDPEPINNFVVPTGVWSDGTPDHM